MRKVYTCYNTIMLHAQYARTHKYVGIRGQIFTETNDDQDLCDTIVLCLYADFLLQTLRTRGGQSGTERGELSESSTLVHRVRNDAVFSAKHHQKPTNRTGVVRQEGYRR